MLCVNDRFIRIFLIISVIIVQVDVKSDKNRYNKVTKAYVNSSGITTTNLSCYVKPLSPYDSIFGVQADFKRTLNNFFLSNVVFHKPPTGTKFYQIFNLKNVEICKMAKVIRSPAGNLLKNWFEYTNLTFAGIIHECPYKVESMILLKLIAY
jgi:hypothetical protein